MVPTIYYYLNSKDSTDQLGSKAEIAINHSKNGAQVLLLKDIADTYMPRCWIAIIKKWFENSPERFHESFVKIDKPEVLKRQFEVEAKKSKKYLSLEQQFIVDNIFSRFSKAGVSLSEISINADSIKFSTIGDNFVFIFDHDTKKLSVYCSMISEQGKVDFSQPCHAFYSDLTSLGTTLQISKKIADLDIFIMTRDLANWFMEEFHKNKITSIDILRNLDDSKFDELLSKCAQRGQYLGIPFNTEGSALVFIPLKKKLNRKNIIDSIISFIKRYKLYLAGGSILVSAIIAFVYFIVKISSK